MSTRSLLTPSGITAMKRKPNWAQARAMAMLVDPLDASITVLPGRRRPSRQAFSRMYLAMRSFVDPLGFRNSSLHQMEGSESSI